MISDVLSERVLYSWQGKDIERRVIVITSILPDDVNSVMQKSLSVSVCIHDIDFVFLSCVIQFCSKKY
jgi:ferredoxin-fold anticodon binding domain-containing protein